MSEYKLVPVEPTYEIQAAMQLAFSDPDSNWSDIYKAGLAAAPTNPQPVSSRLVDELRALVEKWRKRAEDLCAGPCIAMDTDDEIDMARADEIDAFTTELDALIEWMETR